MTNFGSDSTIELPPDPTPPVVVKVARGEGRESEKRFTSSFVIGRSGDCDFQIVDACVSRNHLEVSYDGQKWRLKDLDSANGTFLNGERIDEAPLPDSAEIELGKGGPLLSLTVEKAEEPKVEAPKPPRTEFASETQIIRHYLDESGTEPAGEQTMMFRRAFARVQKKKSRKYQWTIGVVLVLLIATATVTIYQAVKLHKLRLAAENIFYTTKTIELEIGQLQAMMAARQASQLQVEELQAKRQKLKELEKQYDGFVKELGTYKGIPEEQKIILRVARVFGECDVNVPEEFVAEVKRYIKIWKSSDRLAKALQRADQKGYRSLIPRALSDNNLPPHYFYLPLQESDFQERAVGRPTRYGIAKGVWQFIPVTAQGYGLKLGPLHHKGVYDPADERCQGVKSTVAAMKYIRDLSNTEAQASGLLVMASYNWGESNILAIINRMPLNPRERNFWRFLTYKDIPRQTYDYVFLIFSAAVICEKPELFGFSNLECPVFAGKGR